MTVEGPPPKDNKLRTPHATTDLCWLETAAIQKTYLDKPSVFSHFCAMLNRTIPSLPSFLLLAFLSCSGPALAQEKRPNIIIMMVDDLGFSDYGCYGSEIETPNIDALAENGLRFRNFYNTAKCHSSRVSLLTGLYCNQAGSNALNRGVTIAEVLGKAGYSTNMVGKWHLNSEPTERGFQRYFGHLSGATNFFTGDDTFRLNGKPWSDFDKDFYTTDANIHWAKKFLSEALTESPDQPFFLYVAHNSPHYPLHVKESDFRKYEDRYREGWDAVRQQRHRRQLEMGIVPASWDLAPRPPKVPAWDQLSEIDRDWEARRMAAFAGMVDSVDQTTGELVAFLKEQGQFDNTLIMICSDNGACPFDRTRGAEFDPWDPRSYWCYDTGWSHVGNTPFRLHKQNQHEGGISSPLIVHWPGGLAAKNGSIVTQRGHLVDFMATCIDVAETEYPTEWEGIDLEPLVGKSLVPIFQGKQRQGHDYLYFQFSTNRAVIKDNWKLVTHRASSWELFDIEKDGTEMHNIAAQHPEAVEDLSKLWHQTAEEIDRLKPAMAKPVSGAMPPLLQKDGRPARTDGNNSSGNSKKKPRRNKGKSVVLFDGKNFDYWEMEEEGGWVIESDGSMTCLMKEVERKGKKRTVGRGYLWSKREYGNFELTLSYKLSEGANSGVFYRTNIKDPVQGGFELQLMDNEGFQKTHGKKDERKLNGSFYDCQAPASDPQNPIGQWNDLTIRCQGPRIQFTINGVQVIDVDVNNWPEAGKNPDGTTNKFKTAMKDKPRIGHIGLQNHGQPVWFRNVSIREL